MIEQFNRKQLIFAVLRALLSILIFSASFWFFKTVIAYFAWRFHTHPSPLFSNLASAICIIAIAVTGFKRWQMGVGNLTMTEASIPTLDTHPLLASMSDKRMVQSATINYILATFFLAAPLQMLKAYEHLRLRIPEEHGLEMHMLELLADIQRVGKWHDFSNYPGRERELIFLINMGKVDYSSQKGRIKAA